MPFTQDAQLELAFPAERIPAELDEKLAAHNLHVRGGVDPADATDPPAGLDRPRARPHPRARLADQCH